MNDNQLTSRSFIRRFLVVLIIVRVSLVSVRQCRDVLVRVSVNVVTVTVHAQR